MKTGTTPTSKTQATEQPLPEQSIPRFITSLSWDTVPERIRERMIMAAIDTLAAMIAGVSAASTRIAAKNAAETFASGVATLVADPRRVRAEGAAFANAVAANAYDLDDVSVHTWGHPGAQILPTALAVAEETGAGGKELLTALLVGYEIAARQALCLYAEVPESPERTYRGCAAWGAVAAAATAARLLGLSEEQTWEALGIAEYHAPDAQILRDVHDPGMVKHGHGPAALTGIMAARLARSGFTGTTGLLGEDRFAGLIGDLGECFLVEGRGIEWKRFACCAWAHPALHALKSLPASALDPERIKRIVVEAHFDSHHLGTRLPTTTEEAQFSMSWPLAAYLLDGEVGVPQVDERRIADRQVSALASRVELRRSEELDRLYLLAERDSADGQNAARVTIELHDGRRLDSGVVSQQEIETPWTLNGMRHKFRWATQHVLSKERATAILDAIDRLPQMDDVSKLTRQLAIRS